jgi:Icc protein
MLQLNLVSSTRLSRQRSKNKKLRISPDKKISDFMKTNFKMILAVTLLFVATTALSQTGSVLIKGSVFIDSNNNGLRDANENGVKGVTVSDQSMVVATDDAGFFQFNSSKNLGFVFITQPDGFTTKGTFWKKIPAGPEAALDFPLIKSAKPTKFTFIHASDTHIADASLARMQKLKALTDSIKPAFVLVTGDLIKDALRVDEAESRRLYEMYVREVTKFSVPVWNVPGNHEIFGIERQSSLVSEKNPLYGKKMYRHYLGPDYYSFNYGGVHFIGLNSVDYEDLWYYGHIDSLQMEWLKKDIVNVSKTTPIVTFNHIPFYSGGHSMWEFEPDGNFASIINVRGKKVFRHVVDNAMDVMALLDEYNFPMALSGHYHASQQFTIDGSKKKIKFYQTGAVVGPSTTGIIKMPSGVTLYTVENGKIDDGKFIVLK